MFIDHYDWAAFDHFIGDSVVQVVAISLIPLFCMTAGSAFVRPKITLIYAAYAEVSLNFMHRQCFPSLPKY